MRSNTQNTTCQTPYSSNTSGQQLEVDVGDEDGVGARRDGGVAFGGAFRRVPSTSVRVDLMRRLSASQQEAADHTHLSSNTGLSPWAEGGVAFGGASATPPACRINRTGQPRRRAGTAA
jgi:hypothetical protein